METKYTLKNIQDIAKCYHENMSNNIMMSLSEQDIDATLAYQERQKEITRDFMFKRKS